MFIALIGISPVLRPIPVIVVNMTSGVIVPEAILAFLSLSVQAMLFGAFAFLSLSIQAMLFGAFAFLSLSVQALLLGAFPLLPLRVETLLFGAFLFLALRMGSLRRYTGLRRLSGFLALLLFLLALIPILRGRLDYRRADADEQQACQRVNNYIFRVSFHDCQLLLLFQ
ncbi:MAG: hypothetical protein AB9917_19935 [Negativicutes bacterium]